jgi:copper chaperone CopZ
MEKNANLVRREFRIEGMGCAHCVNAVREALAGVPNVRVEDVQVGSATVSYDPALVGEDRIRAAVAAAGYEVAR